jgi:acyl-CoA thioesterase
MSTLIEYLGKRDRFATSNGCRLVEISEGYAKATMTVEDKHLNGGNVCQGGAYFTLADIAIAAAMNSHGTLTFGIENNISFLKSAFAGDVLTAEAREIVNHHKIPYVEARITNQKGELLCIVTGLAYRKDQPILFDSLT